ncbi:biotin--[acetyl-CoA-carboxylase] ligase [candidate division KSB1 bacterium]|nr:biotin--[acetyl-CoA-carboxylase] ligase [candidate division KSB1 bacterium]RQW07004.1 MAG: biotin--[acetyl-CoA-carboxylase] ligase [candidate division KSB1 bacterium]
MFNMRIGSRIIRLDKIDSTNSYLKRFASQLHTGTVVVATEQTHGRGRGQKQWFSCRQKSLTFSVILSQKSDAHIFTFMHLFPAVAVVKALRSLGIRAFIKWPNDIILAGKKIGGILVDAVTRSGKIDFIIGVGLNVNEERADFPEEVRETAGSILTTTEKAYDINTLLNAVLRMMNIVYPLIQHSESRATVRALWCDYCGSLNGIVAIRQNNANIYGKFVGLDENGFAVIKSDEQELIIRDYVHVSLRELYDTCN